MIGIILSACNTTKYLQDGETLLVRNEINVIDSNEKVPAKKLEASLLTVLPQSPNAKFLGLFRTRLWYYYNTHDTSLIGTLIKKKLAEPPVLISEDEASRSALLLKSYLIKKGYRSTQVSYDIEAKNKKGVVKYSATPGKLMYIDSVIFEAADTAIQRLLTENSKDSYLQPGIAFDKNFFDLESFRITGLFRNEGYYTFNNNFIRYFADTSNQKLVTKIAVLNPDETSRHQKFYVGNYTIYDDTYSNLDNTNLNESTNRGIKFLTSDRKFYLDTATVPKFIYLNSGNLYNGERERRTVNKLNRLDITRLVRMVPTLRNDTVDFTIYLPRNQNMLLENNFDINYSTFNQVQGRNLFGVSGSVLFQHRNLFRGAERLTSSFQIGADINLRSIDELGILNAFTFQVKNDLNFPKFIDLFRFMHLFNRLKFGKNSLVSDELLASLNEEATTRLGLNYDFIILKNFYTYHSLNSSFGFELIKSRRKKYQFNPIGLDLWIPETKEGFDLFLEEPRNSLLRNSFGTRLFTGIFFRNLLIDITTAPNKNGNVWRIISNLESSGHEVALTNLIYNGLKDTFKLGSIEFSQFAKAEIDIRRYIPIVGTQTLALRFATGVALPFGTSHEVPYLKQFYLGGPLSVRAWRVRELGPGSYEDPLNETIREESGYFYQAADFKLEFGLEWRFPIFWRFAGALFLDGGNIWSLRSTDVDLRPGAQLSKNFLKEIALGSGFGIRTDFSYFILRVDVGSKIRSPYKIDGRYYPYRNLSQALSLNKLNFNLALDYPF